MESKTCIQISMQIFLLLFKNFPEFNFFAPFHLMELNSIEEKLMWNEGGRTKYFDPNLCILSWNNMNALSHPISH